MDLLNDFLKTDRLRGDMGYVATGNDRNEHSMDNVAGARKKSGNGAKKSEGEINDTDRKPSSTVISVDQKKSDGCGSVEEMGGIFAILDSCK